MRFYVLLLFLNVIDDRSAFCFLVLWIREELRDPYVG
jgi:hypothetical protein